MTAIGSDSAEVTDTLFRDTGFTAEPLTVVADRRMPEPPKPRASALGTLLGADVVGLAAALLAGQAFDLWLNGGDRLGDRLATLVYLPAVLIVMGCYGLYRRGGRRLVGSSFPDFGPLAHSIILGSLLVLLLSGVFRRLEGWPNMDRTAVTASAVVAVATVPGMRAFLRWLGWRHRGTRSRVLVVGSGVVAASVMARLRMVSGVELCGCVDDNSPSEAMLGVPLVGGLMDIPDIVRAKSIDHVVVAFSPTSGAELAAILRSLSTEVQISIVPRLFDLLTVRSHVDDLYGLPVVDVAPPALGPADRFAKRAMDMIASGMGLLLLSPIMLTVAAAIRLTSSGPALFAQQRTGRGGRPFNIYKFRSMRTGAEAERATLENEVDGPLFKVREDPRVTPIGRILRKTSLDELPQLINVFKGDMSLVGPRPFRTAESAEIDGWAARRFDVRPGMTGLWQVSGRNDLPYAELRRLDYSYVASWSLWWDLRILWHTPGVVLRQSGAY